MDAPYTTFDKTILVAVDFDGTLTKKDNYPSRELEVDHEAVYWVKRMKGIGAELILYTCREGKLLDEAVDICYKHGLTFDYVNEGNGKRGDSRKVKADFYIDDRATVGKIRWRRIYRHILKLKSERRNHNVLRFKKNGNSRSSQSQLRL